MQKLLSVSLIHMVQSLAKRQQTSCVPVLTSPSCFLPIFQCANCLERGAGRGERILHSDLHVGAVAKKQDKKEINLFFLFWRRGCRKGQGRATLSASCEEDAATHKRCWSETRPQPSCRQQLPLTALHRMALQYGRKHQTQQQGGVISLHVDWLHRVKPKWVSFTCICLAGVPDQWLQKPAESSLLWDSHAHIIASTWAPPSLQHSLCCDLCFPACLHSWVGNILFPPCYPLELFH